MNQRADSLKKNIASYRDAATELPTRLLFESHTMDAMQPKGESGESLEASGSL
ncbi:MAG: hypothetical protein PS018_28520 [bacterium]|nr:hypothetical protein [bacterium]